MAITPTNRQVGRMSASMTLASINGTDTVSNALLLAACEQGPLYKLLNASYADVSALLTAFATAGGLLNFTSDRPGSCKVSWSIAANKAILSVVDTLGAPATVAVTISLAYTRDE
jgi:hypothetical protein